MMQQTAALCASWLPRFNYVAGIAGRMVNPFSPNGLLRPFAALLLASFAMFGAAPAMAQTVSYIATNNGDINEDDTPCNNPLVRTYNVTETFTLGDVDIGVRGMHGDRSDVRVTLEHPDGTRVQVVDGNIAIFGNNFNFLLNDEGTQVVNTDGNGTNHTPSGNNTSFEHDFIPNSPLSAFDGKTANGTWRLEICDIFDGDSGRFFNSVLYLTAAALPSADLSLSKAVSAPNPTSGSQVTYTLAVTNNAASTLSATATIRDVLPAGVQYVSDDSAGAYNSSTGLWTPGALAPGQTRSINIVVTVQASRGASIVNTAEIETSTQPDGNSTPGNGTTGEDDYASASFTVGGNRLAGIAPTLICPNGSLPFKWSNGDWIPGDENSTVSAPGLGPVNWDLQLPSGAAWGSNSTYGGTHPRLTNAVQNTLSLSVNVNMANRSQLAQITIDLGEVTEGVQFTVFDIDNSSGFADFIRVTGYRDGVQSALPVITNGVVNYVIGNEAFGDANSSDSQTNGNVVVTFFDPIDEILVEYGNHALAPTNPTEQGIQFPGLTFCKPVADLTVIKSSSVVSDGITTGDNDIRLLFPVPCCAIASRCRTMALPPRARSPQAIRCHPKWSITWARCFPARPAPVPPISKMTAPAAAMKPIRAELHFRQVR